jgi:hypothetical protein
MAKGLCLRHYYRQKRGGNIQTKSMKEKTTVERFLEKFTIIGEDECWEWTGTKNYKGYGQFRNGKMNPAHRFSYEYSIGPIPKGLLVCHKCDNPACVNPNHLFTGSGSDNMQDMVNKGRHGKGGTTKRLLTVEQAIYVFTQKGQRSLSELMREFNVSKPTISSIWHRRNYREVTKDL